MTRLRDSRKTVGIFMHFLSEIRGGPDVTAMWLIQALCDQFNVTLVTTSQFNLDFFNRFAGTELKQDQFQIRRVPLLPTPRALPMTAIQGPLFQRSAKAIAADFDVCLNAMNLLDLGVPAVHFIADLGWLRNVDHDSDSSAKPARLPNSSLPRCLYHAISARIQAKSGRDLLREDVLVSNSEWVASSLRTIGVESTVIYPPVPWPPRKTDWDAKRKDFVWIGRIDPSKKLEQAIDIVAALRNTGIDCALHIVGTAADKNYLASIRALAERMGDWVVLEGPLYGDEKVEFLEQFRYAIHTRADEPFGISLVELMKAGCIPFAPDSCGSAEILNHSALLFADTDQAVCKIGNVFADPDFSQSILSFLSHRTEAFSTDGFCESVVALVSSMIDRALPAFDFASSPAQAGSGRRGPYGN